jgi:hypothetical protein
MNPIEEQRELIDKLYWLVKSSLNGAYDTASCWFDYQRFEDGSASIGARLSCVHNGRTEYGRLKYPDDRILDDVIPQLHEAMKAHTGGDWDAFTLTINADGSVTTKFEYPDQEPTT